MGNTVSRPNSISKRKKNTKSNLRTTGRAGVMALKLRALAALYRSDTTGWFLPLILHDSSQPSVTLV